MGGWVVVVGGERSVGASESAGEGEPEPTVRSVAPDSPAPGQLLTLIRVNREPNPD